MSLARTAARAAAAPVARVSGVRGQARRQAGMDEAARRMLLYGVMPAWIGAGAVDWWRHRRTRIETTSGVGESALHVLMMTEASIPTMLGLFCEVNAGVPVVAGGALGLHQATAYADVAFAQTRRHVSPGEQQVHSLLEVVPMAAAAILSIMHWDQTAGLLGRGGRRDWRLRPKERPLSGRVKTATLAGVVILGALPYAEEMIRCLRARNSTGQDVGAAGPEPSAENI
ncbi:MAG TPA: diguanylate cyclase/phosphodiesterase [Amycolatopsis sp.]|jgi:hypothetical protein|nr:diguanylate cyclase/phosphodiesterase [Amycolatopsis sp.]